MKFNEWKKLNEIGDRISVPDIVKKQTLPFSLDGKDSGKTFMYDIKVKNEFYRIVIQLMTHENKTALRIDFGNLVDHPITGKEMSMKMTNSNIMLEVMSNLIGVIEEWLNDYEGDETIYTIVVIAKAESESDTRRSNIYDLYIRKNIEKLGSSVKEVVDISKEWSKKFPEEAQSKVTKFRIDPISLDKIRKTIG
jgi:hypothetical protein